MAGKATLRKQMLQRREAAEPKNMAAASQKICDRFFAGFDLSEVKRLHIFLSIPEKNELNTWPIINKIWRDYPKIQLAVPVTPPGATELQHRLLGPKTVLLKSKWGIEEPTEASPLIAENEMDMVLVPLLAFDLRGHRVGYGKGYYDKFLSKCRPGVQKIGLSVFEPVEIISDAGDWDIKLDFCVTPGQVFAFDKK